MRALFLIPARGGSKGLTDKNIQSVGGIPLVGRAVRTAIMSGKADRVVCSTDSAVIGATAHTWGAEVLRRPDELASDSASLVDVALHAADRYPDCDTLVMLQPTSALVGAEDIRGAIEAHERHGVSIASVCDNEHPPEWSRVFDLMGKVRQSAHAGLHQRQDIMPTLRVNGAIYVTSIERLRETRTFIPTDARAFDMPVARSIDIDTARDLYLADILVRHAEPASVKIAECNIGPGRPCFVVAEVACNHQGDPELGFRMIDAAREAGCDAVKFQAFRTEFTVPPEGVEAIKPLEFDMRSQVMMKHYCEKSNMVYIATPFDTWSVDMLADIGVYALKVGSGDLNNLPLLQRVASKGKPVILSTGMGNIVEVEMALRVLAGLPVVLMHCVSLYPAQAGQMNLRAMETMRAAFGVPVGLSDHTIGTAVPLAAIALGASAIEKHITLDRGMEGPDHAMSLPTADLARFVADIRAVEAAQGTGYKAPCDEEMASRSQYRRGVYAWRDIAAGELFAPDNILARRPEAVLPPAALLALDGKMAPRAYKAGEAICES